MFITFKGREMYIYGTFKSYDAAVAHLEDMFADGAVSQGERPEIAKIQGKYRILLAA